MDLGLHCGTVELWNCGTEGVGNANRKQPILNNFELL